MWPVVFFLSMLCVVEEAVRGREGAVRVACCFYFLIISALYIGGVCMAYIFTRVGIDFFRVCWALSYPVSGTQKVFHLHPSFHFSVTIYDSRLFIAGRGLSPTLEPRGGSAGVRILAGVHFFILPMATYL